MKLSQEQYKEMYAAEMPRSRIGRDCLMAFLVGGAICLIGQILLTLYRDQLAMSEDKAALLTSLSLIALSAILTGFGLYDKIARHAGAGTLVPITGFANAGKLAGAQNISYFLTDGLPTYGNGDTSNAAPDGGDHA